ncbi:acetoacetate--CoA ligase [Reinekea blandensis]|uniref:Acetyl-coenzyme A synthetase n=1 Tax=Reinekea blandensis MED297 TaxID=314283 RepID=A4BIH6_9GAMM|nr:acetoacetate--CoA ligase [Reinekea blandensis]EAR08055.1 acetyl-coenzyme A synthetase [Reinekea sp. MED297] [Reinekea blandensis MED297]
MSDLLYQPSEQQMAKSQLTAFSQQLTAATDQPFPDYPSLHQYSITHLDTFWRQVWQFGGVIGEPGDTVLTSNQMPGARWFPDAQLNFAENLLAHGHDEQTALINLSESRGESRLSYGELRHQVMQLAAYLKQECDVQPGDRVCAYLGNTPEALIGMLATTWLGATWSSASPDFGREGALDRFGQIEPKVLIAGNGYRYGGKDFDRSDVIQALMEDIPSIKHALIVPVLATVAQPENTTAFDDAVSGQRLPPDVTRFPFDHPLYILFSSGTTGKPKCIVHSAGGTLLQHIKELRLHGDIRQDSVFFYFTTTGWMMWNWLASGLVTGATLVLYDGNPMAPTPDVLWAHAANLGITHFGTSAKYLSACRKQNLSIPELPALQVIFSTGSPLAPEDFDWVYQEVKPDVLLHSISGGTDIVSCFVGGNPWSPVVKGKIQAANLGMAVESWSDEGKPLIDQRGELVCTRPAPCMPLGFWKDDDQQRYRAAYFERFPGVWAHGDFCTIDAQGQVVILGRSDTTLNPGGVRIGTAEIYRQVELIDAVQDSLVVGRPNGDDMDVVLFVVLSEGVTLTDELKTTIAGKIRQNTTPRHVPRFIIEVPAIPYTRSGKKVELAVTQILRGESPKNLTALANADCLAHYQRVADHWSE